jgi:hypothetical protein
MHVQRKQKYDYKSKPRNLPKGRFYKRTKKVIFSATKEGASSHHQFLPADGFFASLLALAATSAVTVAYSSALSA